MSEARELFERFRDNLRSFEKQAADQSFFNLAEAMAQSANALDYALATQPEPGAVPELPEWVECDEDGDYIVHFDNGLGCCLAPHYRAEDYDRIAEACRILAARERARRAGS